MASTAQTAVSTTPSVATIAFTAWSLTSGTSAARSAKGPRAPDHGDNRDEPPGQHQAMARDLTQVWEQRRCSRVAGRNHVVDDLLGEPEVDHRAQPATNHPAATAPVPSIARRVQRSPGPPEPDDEHHARGQQREQKPPIPRTQN